MPALHLVMGKTKGQVVMLGQGQQKALCLGQGPWQSQRVKGYALQHQSVIITVKIDVVKFPFPGQRVWSNTPWAIYYGEKGRTKVKSIGSKDLMVKPWSSVLFPK